MTKAKKCFVQVFGPQKQKRPLSAESAISDMRNAHGPSSEGLSSWTFAKVCGLGVPFLCLGVSSPALGFYKQPADDRACI